MKHYKIKYILSLFHTKHICIQALYYKKINEVLFESYRIYNMYNRSYMYISILYTVIVWSYSMILQY